MPLIKKCPECGRRYTTTFFMFKPFNIEIFGLVCWTPCDDDMKYSFYLFIGDTEVFWLMKDYKYINPDDLDDERRHWKRDIGTDMHLWLLDKLGLIDLNPWVQVPVLEYMDRWHDLNTGMYDHIPRSEWLAERNMEFVRQYEERTGKKL
jgi:hypothetical protein